MVSNADRRADSAAEVVLTARRRSRQLTQGQQIAQDLRVELLKEPGLGECLSLCDASEIDRVCELVAEDFALARLGHSESVRMGRAVRELLIEPLQRYVAALSVPKRVLKLPNGERITLSGGRRMEQTPAEELMSSAGRVADALDAGVRDEGLAVQLTDALRRDWFRWLGYVASYWLQFKVPELITQKKARQEQGRLGGKAPKSGANRSSGNAELIVAAYRELSRSLEPKNVAGAVARKMGCTPQWVRRVWSRAEATEATLERKAKRQAGV